MSTSRRHRRFLSGKSIDWKLNAAFGLFVLAVLLVVVFSAVGGRRATQSINRTSDLRLPAALASVRAQTELLEMVANVRAYLVSGDTIHISDYDRAKAAFEVTLNEMVVLAHSAADPEQLKRLSALELFFNDWVVLSERMFELHDNRRENQPALRMYHAEARPLSVAILGEISDMIAIQQKRDISVKNSELLKEMVAFRSSFDTIITNLHAYAVTGDLSFRSSYMTRLPLNTADWEKLRRMHADLTVEQQEKLDNVTQLRDELFDWPFEIFATVEGEQAYADLYLFRTESVAQADEMMALLDTITTEERQLLETDLRIGRQGLSRAQFSIAFVGVLALLMAIGLAVFFRESIVGSLKRLTKTAEKIAHGDLEAVAVVESADEIGQLAVSFNSMTTRLRDTIGNLEQQTKSAKAASHAKSRFLANMSHELHTPLNGILGYAQHLEQQPTLSAEQADAVRVIQQSGQHLLTLIEDLLDLSKIEAGKLELYPAEVHFPNLIEGIVSMFQLSAEKKTGRAARATALSDIELNIVPAELGDDAPLWGAVALVADL
jgi:signal transduction histidine kinase